MRAIGYALCVDTQHHNGLCVLWILFKLFFVCLARCGILAFTLRAKKAKFGMPPRTSANKGNEPNNDQHDCVNRQYKPYLCKTGRRTFMLRRDC